MTTLAESEYVALDGLVLRAEAARVSPLGEGFMAGRAVFETIRLLDGQPTFLSAHHARANRSARALGLDWNTPLETLRERLIELAARNSHPDGAAKIVCFRDPGGSGELILTRPCPYSETQYQRGFRLKTVIDARTPTGAAHKTTSYLKNLLAREQARAAGCDEALFVSEHGEIFEGSATNLFVLRSDRLATPPLIHAVLPGIVRGQVLARASFPTSETMLTMEMLLQAEAVFVTNALLGVMPVVQIDEHILPLAYPTKITALRAEFTRWQRESLVPERT